MVSGPAQLALSPLAALSHSPPVRGRLAEVTCVRVQLFRGQGTKTQAVASLTLTVGDRVVQEPQLGVVDAERRCALERLLPLACEVARIACQRVEVVTETTETIALAQIDARPSPGAYVVTTS